MKHFIPLYPKSPQEICSYILKSTVTYVTSKGLPRYSTQIYKQACKLKIGPNDLKVLRTVVQFPQLKSSGVNKMKIRKTNFVKA